MTIEPVKTLPTLMEKGIKSEQLLAKIKVML